MNAISNNSDYRPTFAEIDLAAVAHNIQEIQKRVQPARVMAVVKANAYGHGLAEIAQVSLQNGAHSLGVALLEEGIQLREVGIQKPILVFGGFFEDQIDAFLKYDLELTLFNKDRAGALTDRAKKLNKRARVHIKVDTGMGRVGVDWREAVRFVRNAVELPRIEVVGIYTHFASADEKDTSFAELQMQRFRHVLTVLEEQAIRIPVKHAANSGAIWNMPDSYLDLVRLGVMLYGYFPSLAVPPDVPIRPAMSLKSKVILLKEVQADSPISYGSTYRTGERTRIATIPIGYGDGYNRLLSNKGEVLIKGKRFPVVGRVCMDQIMVDVGINDSIRFGDEVVLLGRQGSDEITIYEICEKLDTIPYEVTCWVSNRVRRVFKQ